MLKPRTTALLIAGALLNALLGCGAKSPTVAVHGKVTFAGGLCPVAGHISFSPLEVPSGMPRRPGSAHFDRDGEFIVTSFEPGDGLLPGRYEVLISCIDGMPDVSQPNAFRDADFVPADYKPEQLVIEAGKAVVEVGYDVPLKKKR